MGITNNPPTERRTSSWARSHRRSISRSYVVPPAIIITAVFTTTTLCSDPTVCLHCRRTLLNFRLPLFPSILSPVLLRICTSSLLLRLRKRGPQIAPRARHLSTPKKQTLPSLQKPRGSIQRSQRARQQPILRLLKSHPRSVSGHRRRTYRPPHLSL